ncbi:hypothetical protein GOV04_00985 [Candidatus Woesearchaeota archaeon]|nr:hypothetical protein [Candidatus Woesearchaeota archaeon]
MDEKFLLKIAFIVSSIGVIGLFFLTANSQLPLNQFVEDVSVDETVSFVGTVIEVSDTGKVLFLTVEQDKTVKVVAFKDETINRLMPGDKITVIGTLTEYQGEKEIIADSITLD